MRMAVPVCAPGTRRLRRLHPNDASGRAKRRRPPAQGRTVRPCPQLLLAREPCSLLCITVLAPDLLLYRVALGRAPPYSPRAHREAVSSSQTFSPWCQMTLSSAGDVGRVSVLPRRLPLLPQAGQDRCPQLRGASTPTFSSPCTPGALSPGAKYNICTHARPSNSKIISRDARARGIKCNRVGAGSRGGRGRARVCAGFPRS